VLHGQPVEPLAPVPAQPAVGAQLAKAGRPRRESSTYVRQGTACLLAAFEPGTGQRLVEVSARRTGTDYCRFRQDLAAHYPQAEKIVLVQKKPQHPYRRRFLPTPARRPGPRTGRPL
jgi:hypothetical protein